MIWFVFQCSWYKNCIRAFVCNELYEYPYTVSYKLYKLWGMGSFWTSGFWLGFQIRFVTRPDFNSLSSPSSHSFVRSFVMAGFLRFSYFLFLGMNQSRISQISNHFCWLAHVLKMRYHKLQMHWACIYRLQNWKLKWAISEWYFREYNTMCILHITSVTQFLFLFIFFIFDRNALIKETAQRNQWIDNSRRLVSISCLVHS